MPDDDAKKEYRQPRPLLSYRHPMARRFLEEKDDDTTRTALRTGASLAALGTGLLGLRRLVLTDPDYRTLDRFMDLDLQNAATGRTYGTPGNVGLDAAVRKLSDYSSLGSEAMLTQPFGSRPSQAVKFMRSLPFLKPENRWRPELEDHYSAFEKGPLHGFSRFVEESVRHNWAERDQNNDPAAFSKWYQKMMNRFVEDKTGVKGYFSGTSPAGYADNKDTLFPKEKQMELLKEFAPWLKSEYTGPVGTVAGYIPYTDSSMFRKVFRPELERTVPFGVEAATKNYRENILDGFLKLYNSLGPVGWAGLIGGTGLGAYGLYRHFTKDRRMKKIDDQFERNRREAQEDDDKKS